MPQCERPADFSVVRLMTTTSSFSSIAQCIDVLVGLQSLASGSVSCTVTSPPYNIGVKYNTHDDNRGDYLPWMESVFTEIKRVRMDNGHFFLQMGGTSVDPLIPQRVLGAALQAGWSIICAGIVLKYFSRYRSGTFLKSGTMKLKRPPQRAELTSNILSRPAFSFGSTTKAKRRGRTLTTALCIKFPEMLRLS